MFTVNFAASLAFFSAAILVIKAGYVQNLVSCRLLVYSVGTSLAGNVLMTPFISMLRLYMGILAAKAKLARWYKVLPTLLTFSLVSYSIWPAFLQLTELSEARSGITNCMSQQRPNKMMPLKFFMAFYVFTDILIGLFCDSSLYYFVKRRQEVKPPSQN